MQNPTDKEIATFYGVTVQTLGNYKRGDIGKQRLYRAMKTFYSLPALSSRVEEVASLLRSARDDAPRVLPAHGT